MGLLASIYQAGLAYDDEHSALLQATTEQNIGHIGHSGGWMKEGVGKGKGKANAKGKGNGNSGGYNPCFFCAYEKWGCVEPGRDGQPSTCHNDGLLALDMEQGKKNCAAVGGRLCTEADLQQKM